MIFRRTAGAAILGALALLFSASPAAASYFDLPVEEATVQAEPTEYAESQVHTWTFSFGQVGCSPTFTGDLLNEAVTLQPTMPDNECSSGFDVDLDANGCAFVFHPGEEIAAGEWQGKYDVADASGRFCAPGIVIASSGCTYTVGRAFGKTGVTFKEVTGSPDKLKIVIDDQLSMTTSGPLWACGSGTTTTYQGAWLVSAAMDEAGEELVDFRIEGDTEWQTPKSETRLEAEQYPATISGTQGEGEDQLSINMFSGDLTCGSVSFDGSLNSGSTTLAATAQQSSCTVGSRPAGVAMNGCEYELDASGSMSVTCPSEKQIEINVYNDHVGGELRCTYKIASQSGLDVAFANVGAGVNQRFNTTLDAEVALTRTFGTFLQCGTANQTRNYEGLLKLSGENGSEETIGIRRRDWPGVG